MKNNNNPSAWSRWPKTRTGFMRHGEPERLLECLMKYPDRQTIADSAFLCGDDIPQIGKDCEIKEIVAFSLKNRNARIITIQRKENGINYAISVFLTKPFLPNLTNSTFLEMKWGMDEDRNECLNFLQFLGECLIQNELLKIEGGEV